MGRGYPAQLMRPVERSVETSGRRSQHPRGRREGTAWYAGRVLRERRELRAAKRLGFLFQLPVVASARPSKGLPL